MPGMLIGMMGGVVEIADVPTTVKGLFDEPKIQIRVNIGKLSWHPMKFSPDTMFDVVTMPTGLRPWFGV